MNCPHCMEDIVILHHTSIKEIVQMIEKAQMLPDWDIIDDVKDILQKMMK
jgi:hypothetical protein